MKRFAAISGLDARLVWFVPASTLLMPLVLLLFPWDGDPAGVWHKGVPGLWPVGVIVALWLLPFTLPAALAGWVAARILCRKAGLAGYRAALVSGFVAGLASMAIPALGSGDPARALPGSLVIGLAAGVSGMLAAAIIYREGWEAGRQG